MNAADYQRIMSTRDLAILGLRDLAYVTRVVVDGKHVYSIHAADGTMIDVMDDRDLAFENLRNNSRPR